MIANSGPTSTHEKRTTVRNGDVELAVFTSGSAEPNRTDRPMLVLMHGWPDTHALWNHVVPHLTDAYTVVTYDARGAGASTVPTRTADYRLDKLADDLFAVIDAVSPDGPVHVLGHDWGAVQAWEAAADPRAIGRIASYVSVSGPNLDYLGMWSRDRLRHPTFRGIREVLAQTKASWYTVTFHIPPLARWRAKRYYRNGWGNFLHTFSNVDPSLVEPSPTLLEDAINGGRLYRANLIPRLTKPRERRVHLPVHLIVNTDDVAVRPFHYEDTGNWVSQLSRTDLVAGHWSPISHAADIARITDEFVTAQTASAQSRSARIKKTL